MKRIVIFLVTLVLGYAGFYAYNKWEKSPGHVGNNDADSLHITNQHIQEITPDMDRPTRLKFWSEHYAEDMSKALMKQMSKGISSELSFRVRNLDFNERSNTCVVEVYTSWLDKVSDAPSFYEVVVKTDFDLNKKTVSSTKLNANAEFNALGMDKELNMYLEQSMIRSMQYLQEVI